MSHVRSNTHEIGDGTTSLSQSVSKKQILPQQIEFHPRIQKIVMDQVKGVKPRKMRRKPHQSQDKQSMHNQQQSAQGSAVGQKTQALLSNHEVEFTESDGADIRTQKIVAMLKP